MNLYINSIQTPHPVLYFSLRLTHKFINYFWLCSDLIHKSVNSRIPALVCYWYQLIFFIRDN